MWKCSDTTFFLRLKHLKSTSIFLGPYLLNYFGYSLMESRWGINVYFTNLYKHLLFSIFSCISIIVSTFKLCLLWKNTNVRASMKNCIMWKLLKKKNTCVHHIDCNPCKSWTSTVVHAEICNAMETCEASPFFSPFAFVCFIKSIWLESNFVRSSSLWAIGTR